MNVTQLWESKPTNEHSYTGYKRQFEDTLPKKKKKIIAIEWNQE